MNNGNNRDNCNITVVIEVIIVRMFNAAPCSPPNNLERHGFPHITHEPNVCTTLSVRRGLCMCQRHVPKEVPLLFLKLFM